MKLILSFICLLFFGFLCFCLAQEDEDAARTFGFRPPGYRLPRRRPRPPLSSLLDPLFWPPESYHHDIYDPYIDDPFNDYPGVGVFDGLFGPEYYPHHCPSPTAPYHGGYSPTQSYWTHGQTLTFHCDPGYTLSGSPTVQCGYSGVWSSSLVPTCVSSYCTAPPSFPYGSYAPIKDRYYHGDTCTFTCSHGYEMSGHATCTCNAGTWNYPAPSCVPRRTYCQAPVVHAHGRIHTGASNNYYYNHKIEFVCDPPYKLQGHAYLICQNDGTWSHAPPTCYLPVATTPPPPVYHNKYGTCDEPKVNTKSYYVPGGYAKAPYKVGHIVSYHCHDNHQLNGHHQSTCMANGQWSNPAPTCGYVGGDPCKYGRTRHNCAVSPCQHAKCPYHPNAVCKVDYCGGCYAYWYVGTTKVECSKAPSSYQGSYCKPPSNLPPFLFIVRHSNGILKTRWMKDEYISYDCPPAYYTKEPRRARCREDGFFDLPPPHCYSHDHQG